MHGDDLISQQRHNQLSYYLYDGLGSARGLSDAVGSLTDTYNYDAFGIELNRSGNTVNHYLYSGEQFDQSLNQYYLRARYYNQVVGRFTQMDVFMGINSDPVTLHKYLYANVDPVNNIDPSGYFGILSLGSGVRGVLATVAIRAPAIGLSAISRGLGHGLSSSMIGAGAAAATLVCLSNAVADLVASKVSGIGTGSGVCKAPKMRVQVQASHAGNTFLTFPFIRGESVLVGDLNRGVTRLQVRNKLVEYERRFGEFSNLAPPGTKAVFKSMVIEVSIGLNAYSGTGTPDLFQRGIVSSQKPVARGNTVRIDVDNISGVNLKFNN